MSKYYEEEQMELALMNKTKPNFKYMDKDGKISKIEYIIFKLERLEALLFKLFPNLKTSKKRDSLS